MTELEYYEMLEAKKRLYHLILKQGENATTIELEIAVKLSMDDQIRTYLTNALGNKK